MKNFVLLLSLILTLCGCEVIIVEETEEKFKEAPKQYPELTFVTVNEYKEILTNDPHEYKVVIYNIDFSNHWWTKKIANELIPKWKSMDTTKVGLYLMSIDCAYLEPMDSFFIKNEVDLPRYVLRDSTDGFCSYKSPGTPQDWIRLTKTTQHVCNNAQAITAKLVFYSTLILDRDNNIKLIEANCEGQRHIVPMPFKMCPENLDELDFSKIEKYRITKKSLLYDAYFVE